MRTLATVRTPAPAGPLDDSETPAPPVTKTWLLFSPPGGATNLSQSFLPNDPSGPSGIDCYKGGPAAHDGVSGAVHDRDSGFRHDRGRSQLWSQPALERHPRASSYLRRAVAEGPMRNGRR